MSTNYFSPTHLPTLNAPLPLYFVRESDFTRHPSLNPSRINLFHPSPHPSTKKIQAWTGREALLPRTIQMCEFGIVQQPQKATSQLALHGNLPKYNVE